MFFFLLPFYLFPFSLGPVSYESILIFGLIANAKKKKKDKTWSRILIATLQKLYVDVMQHIGDFASRLL